MVENHLAPRKVSQRREIHAAEILLHDFYKQIDAGLTILVEGCFPYLMVHYRVKEVQVQHSKI